MKKLFSLIILTLFILSTVIGCSPAESTSGSDNEPILIPDGTPGEAKTVSFLKTDKDLFTDRDFSTEYDASSAINVTLTGNSAQCSSNKVRINGSVISLWDEQTYVISGNLDDGMILVNANSTHKVHIVLNGVNIKSNSSAPIYVSKADKVIVTLAEGTENTLSNGGSFNAIDSTNIDSVIFSKQDITFNGSGSLKITSPAGHGIVSKDDIAITGGTYFIDSLSHGIAANDSIRISGTSKFDITSGKDGLHAENTDDPTLGFVYISGGNFKINSTGDGISSKSTMQIENGVFDITTGGGKGNAPKNVTSYKGIKADSSVLISNGDFNIVSADDGIHSSQSIIINGGSMEIDVSDDAIHADKALDITNGRINVKDSTEGIDAHDVTLCGGTVFLSSNKNGISAFAIDESDTTSTVIIKGGSLYIKSFDDGIDSKGSVSISDGYTAINILAGEKAKGINYVISSSLSGGVFICTGTESNPFSESTQGTITLNVGAQAANSLLSVANSGGDIILKHTPALEYSSIIVSSAEFALSSSYKINISNKSFNVTAN